MLVVAVVSVALVAFIVYALERRSKQEPIVWEDATKLSLFGGLITAGVVFASTTPAIVDTIPEVAQATAKVIAEVAPAVEDMFVGTPSF